MRTHGRAYPITRNDVRGYHVTEPPVRRSYGSSRGYSPNPMGVTTLASINGRGAYGRVFGTNRSAYESVRGLNRNDAYGYARSAVRGDSMARPRRRNPGGRAPTAAEQKRYARGYARTFKKKTSTKRRVAAAAKGVSKKTDSKRRSKRETVYRQMKRQGLGDKAAAARAMREVPFLKSQKGATFHGTRAYTGKAVKTKRPKQYRKTRVTVTKKVPTTKTVRQTRTRRQRVAFGKFTRLRVTDPRTGKSRLSYLYKDKKTGKRRKIPAWAIAGAPSAKAYRDSRYEKRRTGITQRRASASRRVAKRGGVFTPNRTKRKTKMRSTKRSRAAKKGWATRRRRKTTRRAAAKGTRKYRRRTRKNASRAGTSTAITPNKRRRRRTRKNARSATPNRRKTRRRTRRNPAKALTANPRRRRRRTRKNAKTTRALAPNRRRRRSRKNTRRRLTANKSAARVAAGRKAWRTRQRRKSAGVRRGRGRAGVYLARGKVYYKGRKPRRLRGMRGGVRKLPKGRIYVTNKRRKSRRTSRKMRRNGYRRNSFMASFKEGMKSAVVVTTGFVAHKALTRVSCDLISRLLPAPAPVAPTSGLGGTEMLHRLMPLLCGGVIAASGTFLASKFASRDRAVQLGAGMLTSFLHTSVVALLDMNDTTRKALPYVAGYDTQSTAAAIGRFRGMRGVRGVRGLRGMRGLGQQGPSTSILPMYAPTGRAGGIQQAVAGRLGEYFQTSGVGEYFASGVQGIGQYEPAGPMVTQAAAGLGQEIDNGIMPNQADAALTLAEAQAGTNGMRGMRGVRGLRGMRGMGRGLGEFFSAQPSGEQFTVPTSNTWIPGDTNPQLWAGTSPAQDALQTSEIPAGVLESASGNGIF